MTTKANMPSKLRLEILELANEMRVNETLNEEDFRKITLREFAEAAPTAAPLSAEDIRALRKTAHMSQAVFAKRPQLGGRPRLADGTRIEAADRPSVGTPECDPA